MIRRPLLAPLLLTTLLLPWQADRAEAQLTATAVPDAARTHDFELSIRNIMRGSEHMGQAPQNVRWTDDSEWIYFRWRPGGGEWSDPSDLYRVRVRGGEPEIIHDSEADDHAVLYAPGVLSPDRQSRVSAIRGDLYLVDRRTMDVRRLTRTTAAESVLTWSRDGERVFFRRDDNVYAIELDGGAVAQLTNLRPGPAPDDDEDPEGHRAFLESQQAELFEHIRTDQEREARQEEAEERRKDAGLEPVYMAPRQRVQRLAVESGGRYVAVSAQTPAREAERVMVPDWVTDSGFTTEIPTRTKVGDEQGRIAIAVVDVTTGEATWVDLEPGEDGEGGDGEGEGGEGDDPPFSAVSFLGWNDAGTHGLVSTVTYDYNTRRLYSVDAGSGDLTLLDELHDEAWVAGPCFNGCTGWVPGTDRVYFASEASGYAHLYAVDADGSDKRALTSGDWEVLGVTVPEERTHFLLRTNEGSPFDQHAYRMELDGSDRTRITEGRGRFVATPAPDGESLAVVHDRSNRPGELFVMAYEAGASMEQRTTSPTSEWLSFPWKEAEIVHVTASDGVRVPARIYRPADVGAEPNGAGVIFVHGAGYLQNVHNFWSGYYREFMFNHFLAAHGYTVLDIDYRASAGYGRDWRTAIYRHMGGKDLSDQVDGARHLVEAEGVDADRIGLYGGSYGGFITLMALFTAGDSFKAGAALRSVTDWAHYNHPYTGRILNLPQEDDEAYRRSSPIYFAENFRPDQHLVMLHGMVDTNVHFSDVVRLAQRLIELGKENWELAVYPVENHGFAEPSSWTDEYRRIFELFERSIGGG